MFELFFRLAPALKALFELGYEPQESFIYELTDDQYCKLAEAGEDTSIRWYTLISNHPKQNISDLLIITEDEKSSLLDAVHYINKLCEEKTFVDFSAKLQYATNVLPPVFTKDNKLKFGKRFHLKTIECRYGSKPEK